MIAVELRSWTIWTLKYWILIVGLTSRSGVGQPDSDRDRVSRLKATFNLGTDIIR